MKQLLATIHLLLLCAGLAHGYPRRDAPPVTPDLPREGVPKAVPAGVAQHVDLLYAADANVQGEALLALEKLKAQAAPALPYVLGLCEAQRPARDAEGKEVALGTLARRLLESLGKTAPDAFLPTLRDPQSPHLPNALAALVGCAEPAVKSQILGLSQDPAEPIRCAAIKALVPLFGKDGHQDVDARLADVLARDPSAGARIAALELVAQAPFAPDDPREPLVLLALRDPANSVRAEAIARFQGEPSPALFLAVLDKLDKDCCAPLDAGPFLHQAVRPMAKTLDGLLAAEDPALRQKAFLVAYYYLPDLGEDYARRLFDDPSLDLRRAVIRHIAVPHEVAANHADAQAKIHNGATAGVRDRRYGDTLPAAWVGLDQRPVLRLLVRRGLASGDREIAESLLRAGSRAPIDEDLLHEAAARKETQALALARLPGESLTVDELLLSLDETDPKILELALRKARRSTHTDQRPVDRCLAIAEANRSLAQVAYQTVLAYGQGCHRKLFLEKVLGGKDTELRKIGYANLLGSMPDEEARPILLAARDDPDPAVRELVLRQILSVTKKGTPEYASLEKAIASPKVAKQDDRPTAFPVPADALLPKSPEALVEVLWQAYEAVHDKQGLTMELSAEVCQKLASLLKSTDAPLSDRAAQLLATARHRPAAADVVAYLAYHRPSRAKLSQASHFGVAAVEPLTVLILGHPFETTRSDATSALATIVTTTGAAGEEARKALVTRRALVKIMLRAPDPYSRCRAIGLSVGVLPEKVRRAVYAKLQNDDAPGIADAIASALAPPDKRRTPPPESTSAGIAELSQSPQPERRQQAAAWALAATWDTQLGDALFALLHDPDSRVQEVAAAAVCRRLRDDEEARQRVVAMLADESESEQLAALRIFHPSGVLQPQPACPPDIEPALRALAGSGNPQIRLAVVQALRPTGNRRDRELLQRLLEDSNRAVAQAAFDALHGAVR